MTKKNKLALLISVLTIVVAAAIAVTISLFLLTDNGFLHLQADGMDLSLVRNKLTFNEVTESGALLPAVDNTAIDFSSPTTENVFGLTGNSTVIPGSMYSAEMTISSKDNRAFVYWLEVKMGNDNPRLTQAITLTVKVNGETKNFKLKDGFVIGSETSPIATVAAGETSTFVLTMALSDGFGDNSVQSTQISLDLVVHAVQIV